MLGAVVFIFPVHPRLIFLEPHMIVAAHISQRVDMHSRKAVAHRFETTVLVGGRKYQVGLMLVSHLHAFHARGVAEPSRGFLATVLIHAYKDVGVGIGYSRHFTVDRKLQLLPFGIMAAVGTRQCSSLNNRSIFRNHKPGLKHHAVGIILMKNLQQIIARVFQPHIFIGNFNLIVYEMNESS